MSNIADDARKSLVRVCACFLSILLLHGRHKHANYMSKERQSHHTNLPYNVFIHAGKLNLPCPPENNKTKQPLSSRKKKVSSPNHCVASL